jgi:GntR family transcriptional regulator, rspAB operon transcriptional repressor
MIRQSATQADKDDAAVAALSFRIDRRRPVGDQVYDALKAAIISVRLPPGASVSENRICGQFGVSRTPVRNAIIRLVEDELIDVFPQQGSFVSPIKLSSIKDGHFIRKSLELAVLDEAAKVWTPALAAKSQAIVSSQKAALANDDLEQFHRDDERFHQNFSISAGLEGVWSAIRGAKARIDRLHRLAAVEGRLPQVIKEHEAVLDALAAGRPQQARASLSYHLDKILDLQDMLAKRYKSYFVE